MTQSTSVLDPLSIPRSGDVRVTSGVSATVLLPTGVRPPIRRRSARLYNPAELERRMERIRTLLATHDEIYDSVSRNETTQAGFGDPVRRTYGCTCGGSGCGQCERSAVRAAELGIELKLGRVFVEERDPYDTGHEGAFDPEARTQRERAKLIDDTIERLQELELVREGVIADHVDYEEILEAAERRDARGSYRDVRYAVDAMPRRLRGDAAAYWIAHWIRGPILVPMWARQAEADRIAEQILELKNENPDFRMQEIADELAIGRSQVRRVLREGRR